MLEHTPLTNVAPEPVQSAEKFPVRYGCGITLFVWAVPGVLLISVVSSAKKNSLFLMMGPPTVPPKLFHWSTGRSKTEPKMVPDPLGAGNTREPLALSCHVLASRMVLRKYSYRPP